MADNECGSTTPEAQPSTAVSPGPSMGLASNRLWIVILAGVLVVGAAVYLVRGARNPEAPAGMKTNFLCVSEGCGFQESRALKSGETMPLRCPKCGKNSLYVSQTCPQCGQANVMNELRGLSGPSRCTQCGTEIRHGE